MQTRFDEDDFLVVSLRASSSIREEKSLHHVSLVALVSGSQQTVVLQI